jgi:uncharacterized membrane protein YedE/YeeE
MAAWTNAVAGGALIGAATAGLLLVNGRIAGISGILGGAIKARRGFWRWTFLAGLVAAGYLALQFNLAQVGSSTGEIPASIVTLVVAGLLVGFGTAVGGGCTSGHGVSGISNLSPRSIVATVVFIAVAVATVYAVRHLGLLERLGG